MAKQSVTSSNELDEYIVKFFDEGEHSAFLLSGDDLVELLRTGEWEGQAVSEIYLPINENLIRYNFLDREEGEKKDYGWSNGS
jgi:hypothetical protein